MQIANLNPRITSEQDKLLNSKLDCFNKLITELQKRELPNNIVLFVNNIIEQINLHNGNSEVLLRVIRSSQSQILNILEEKLQIVVKRHYHYKWFVMGLSVFGLPVGAVISLILGNISYIGIGLPIGMLIGVKFGDYLDKKAFENGKQIDVEST